MRILSFLLLYSVSTLGLASTAFEPSNAPGPYAVGLQLVQHVDHTRVFKPTLDFDTGTATHGERDRPVQMLVWYPAQPSAQRIVHGDYLRLGLTEGDFSLSNTQIERLYADKVRALRKRMGDAQRADSALSAPTRAGRDAAPAPGKFPVVIYAPGAGGTVAENSDLCELLASHGYVVIAVPSMGAHTRGITIDLEGLEAQAGDISLAIAHAHSLPQADVGRIAAMGFSFGGLASVLVAAKDDRVRALVSVDGSMRSHPEFINGSREAARYVSPARLAVPLLYVAAQPRTLEKLIGNSDLSYSLVNEMKFSDVYGVTFWPMQHADFCSDTLRQANPARYTEYSLQEVATAHNAMQLYVLHFLNARLKGEGDKASSEAFLVNAPRENGLPPHVASVEVTRARAAAPTFASWVAELYQRGFAQAVPAYEARQKLDAQFKPDENMLNNWAYRLMQLGRVKDAIEIFKVNTAIYPSSWNAFDSLAEGYATDKNKALALQNYKKSLELDPGNTNAVEQLKLLGAGG